MAGELAGLCAAVPGNAAQSQRKGVDGAGARQEVLLAEALDQVRVQAAKVKEPLLLGPGVLKMFKCNAN